MYENYVNHVTWRLLNNPILFWKSEPQNLIANILPLKIHITNTGKYKSQTLAYNIMTVTIVASIYSGSSWKSSHIFWL